MNSATVARHGGLLALTLILTGCAGFWADRSPPLEAPAEDTVVETLWRGADGGWIYRVRAEPAADSLDHPVRVDTQWLRNVLSRVEVESELKRRTAGVRGWPAFNDQQLDRLVPAVVHGLARAQPDQEVVFALVGQRGGLRLLDAEVVTTGRVFVDDGRLNVIFGLVDAPVEGAIGGPAQQFIPGSRQQRVGKNWKIRSLTWGSDPVRQDWFTVAAKESSAPLPALPEGAGQAPVGDAEPRPRKPEPATEESKPVAVTPAETEPDAAPVYSDIRRRLEVLQRLRQDDLITEQEYDRKRAEILKAL